MLFRLSGLVKMKELASLACQFVQFLDQLVRLRLRLRLQHRLVCKSYGDCCALLRVRLCSDGMLEMEMEIDATLRCDLRSPSSLRDGLCGSFRFYFLLSLEGVWVAVPEIPLKM